MKRISFFAAALTGLLLATTVPARALTAGSGKAEVYTVTEHIRFNEGTLPLKHGGILLSNFGTETFDPLNKEGKGYIVLLDKETKVLFPATGALNAPKGMAVKDDCLFVADVGCVVVYNMKQPEQRPVKIAFPEGELFVNDIVALGDFLLVSVTNTGHLYSIDVKDCGTIWSTQRPKPKKVADIPGANGLAEHEGTLYVASYDPNENPGEQNVIYAVDMTVPGSKPLNLIGSRYGQYDGVAVSPDGSKLYFSNWKNAEGKAEVGYIDLTPDKKNAVTVLDVGVELQGPADICISDGYLFIPDLPANKLYIMAL
ncbi:hypothetical protein [Rikenella microfusus]|uniref:hypothetical protein n=1 Tax=Rikenella microfusus TaxID=28139 RepID=UPI00248D7B55|nr:hypothetical protein [Rikenella microfusus]